MPALISFSHPMRGENEMRKQRLREFVWVGGCDTAPAAWASGPSTLASRGPWGRRCRGTRGPTRSCERPWVGDAGVYTDWLKWPLGAVLEHLCTLLRRELRRVARAPQPPWRADGAPLGGRLSLSRETRLCASGAIARLASSSGRQPTQTPEEPESNLAPPNRTVRLAGEMSRA